MENLKVSNYFHYYMFHLNADELTAGEKIKATVATIALGVFSLGIVPLICRLAFYDKSFKLLKGDGKTDADKASKLGGKIFAGNGPSRNNHSYTVDLQSLSKMNVAELKKLGQSLPINKLAELVGKFLSCKNPEELFKEGTNILSSFEALLSFKTLTPAELAELGNCITDIQTKGMLLEATKEQLDKEKFKILINPTLNSGKDFITSLKWYDIVKYNDLFSSEHWALLNDDQALDAFGQLKDFKDKQTPVDVLLNNDEERFHRLMKKLNLKELVPYLSEKLKSEAEQEQNKALAKLAELTPEELHKAVYDLPVEELVKLDYSGFKDKASEQLTKDIDSMFGLRMGHSPKIDKVLQNLPAEQLGYLCNGFQDAHWCSIGYDGLAGLDLAKIKDDSNRKKVINSYYKSERVLGKIKSQDQLKIIRDNFSEEDRESYKEYFVSLLP